CRIIIRPPPRSTLFPTRRSSDLIGKADILINNAGIGTFAKLADMDPALWKQIIDVNLMGTYYVTRTVLPQLIEKNSGDIINICLDRKSTRLNSSHVKISYAVFCL